MNVVALASAGTGKTHGLVGAMLRALLGLAHTKQPIDPSRIVATTFSRRAAGEMQTRLFAELDRLATAPSTSSHFQALGEAALEQGIDLDAGAMASRARVAMDRLPRARISTLHAFAFDIVRDRALEVGLPPGFEVASDDEERDILAQSVLRALTHFGENEPDLLRSLATIMGTGEQLADRLTSVLVELQEEASTTIRSPRDDEATMDAQMNELVSIARSLEGDPKHHSSARALLAAVGTPHLADAAADMLIQRSPSHRTEPQERLHRFANDPLLPRVPGGKGSTKEGRANAFALAWTWRSKLGDVAAGAARLLEHAMEEARIAHARSARLGLGAVLRAARDLLRDRPDVAAEVARGIDALFVDEFQDTSRVQCEIVTLLWERDPSRRAPGTLPKLGDLRPDGLFVVGDRKQSIYGFRGADVSVFSAFCAAVAGEPARVALGLPDGAVPVPDRPTGVLVTLRHNHRSAPELVAFTNAVAPKILVPESDETFEARYVEQTEELLVPAGSRPFTAPCVTWLRWKEGPRRASVAEEARVVSQKIDALVRDGRPMKEIAVLARTNEMLDAVAHELARIAIPHVVGGRGFFRAREVRDMLSMLAVIVRPLDRRALLEVARGIWTGLGDTALLGLVEPGRGIALVEEWPHRARSDLFSAQERTSIERTSEVVMRLRRVIDRIGPANALREAIAALDIEATLLLLPRGPQRLANVRKLVHMVEREPSVLAFLDRIDRISLDAREPEAATFSEEDDAVRLLTVHASKGLDFPIVFLPQIGTETGGRAAPAIFASRTDEGPMVFARMPRPQGRSIEPPSFRRAHLRELARERADRRRLAYVAITRASEAMFLVGDRPDPKEGTLGRAVLDLASSNLLRVEHVSIEGARAARAASATLPVTVEGPPMTPPRPRTLPIATTALSDFHHCARRFELVHLLGLPESVSPIRRGDEEDADVSARQEGLIAHRVLEHVDFGATEIEGEIDRLLDREGMSAGPSRERVRARVLGFLRSAYARRIVRDGARTERERSFVLPIEADGTTILLKGSIDLVVHWKDGSTDIVDYKRARSATIEPHAFQLDAYVLALRAEGIAGVRAGIAFLGGSPEPKFRPSPREDEVRRTLGILARRLIEARASERFPRIPIKGCRALRCGYEPLCHARQAGAQLGLFG
jgi:ATP-dependent helicase/nuclease subunit A